MNRQSFSAVHPPLDNAAIASRLREMAQLLQARTDDVFRVTAYARAADVVERLPSSVCAIFARGGRGGLEALPGVGRGIAAALAVICAHGRWPQLERLRAEADPDALLRSVPGIGPRIAQQIRRDLGIASLEALEVAAHDGRLAALPRVGPRRAESVRASLRVMLDRGRFDHSEAAVAAEPPVEELLAVDGEYRDAAQAGELPLIAPRRFNPAHEKWLPVLHTRRGDRHYTALYSNTARAHELGRTRDWVVLYFETDHDHEAQRTIVTETHGAAKGRRVVRGRERECLAFFARSATAGAASAAVSPRPAA